MTNNGTLTHRVQRFTGTNPCDLAAALNGLNLTQHTVTNNIAHDQWLRCEAGEPFNAGDVVYISSYTTLPRVNIAINDVSIFPIGVIQTTVTTNDPVNVLLTGVLTYDTSAWSAGDIVYMSVGGTLTTVVPPLSDLVRITVGKVLSSSASGSILIQLQRTQGNDIYGSYTQDYLEYFALPVSYAINTGYLPAPVYTPPSTTLAVSAAAGATSVTVASAAGISIDEVLWFGDFAEGRIIDNIVGTTITLTQPLNDSYNIGDTVYNAPYHHFYLSGLETGKYLFLHSLSYELTFGTTYSFDIVWRNELGTENVIHTFEIKSNHSNSNLVLSDSGISVLSMQTGNHIFRGRVNTNSNTKDFSIHRFNIYIVRLT